MCHSKDYNQNRGKKAFKSRDAGYSDSDWLLPTTDYSKVEMWLSSYEFERSQNL